MSQSMNQTFAVQWQNTNRQLQGPQNTGNLQGALNAGNLQGALNAGRQAPGPQTVPNLFIDTYTPVQQYNDLVGGSNPFVRMQGVEISSQSNQTSMHLLLGFSFV
ncbi:39986_t:CDS:1 [Gigaspora margarita]|uniref:39986_t:CDS:1 n=1 Tax=Gigaspora margarita TaxID=4874 RepID=A0ABN7W066_GIGMA|nr:39986_t:CDS:1 [Gigaspora margarita]